MGTSKDIGYELTEVELANYAKALGHPARVSIINFLLRRNSCVCGDIVDEIGLSQSTISQHLKALKETGIIKGEINGPSTCYCVDAEVWEQASMAFENFFGKFSSGNSCC